jgi:hypothetical protein
MKYISIIITLSIINAIQPVSDYSSYSYFVKMLNSSSTFIKELKAMQNQIDILKNEIFDASVSLSYKNIFAKNFQALSNELSDFKSISDSKLEVIDDVSSYKLHKSNNETIKNNHIKRLQGKKYFIKNHNELLKELIRFKDKIYASKSIHEDLIINNQLLALLVTENLKNNLAMNKLQLMLANWIDESMLDQNVS